MPRTFMPCLLLALSVSVAATAAAIAQEPAPLAPLPPIAKFVPKDNPMTPDKIELGKMLFFDPRLSGDSSTSCAKCHDPEQGFSNGKQLSEGYPGTKHWRGVPTVLNAAYAKLLFWDGRSPSLEDQATGPIQAPIEMNQNPAHLVHKLRQIPYYRKQFKKAFQSDVTFANLAKAIAAFERTVISRNVPFDAYLKGDKSALDAEQVRGLQLFKGKANCIACHNGALFSDDKLHAVGVPEIEPLKKDSDRVATRHFFAEGAGYKNHNIDSDYGHELISKSAEDRFKFKTPSLREIADTAPYMHNGAFLTLEDVVAFYNKGGGKLPNKDPLIKPLGLSKKEQVALIAFLESLSGDPIEMAAPELPKKDDGTF